MRRFLSLVGISLALAAAADAKGPASDWAGVYKHQFQNGNVQGDKYQSEDILEIVKVSPDTAYVRTHLEFFNGHVCNIWGVARIEGDALVYRGPNNIEGKPCVLSVKAVGGEVTLFDEHDACTVGTCGNRGMYTGEKFDLKTRRAIRYMDVLTKSQQYIDAVKEYEGVSLP